MRRTRHLAAASFAILAGLAPAVAPLGASSANGVFEGPVPRADCANNNPFNLEPALQGEVPLKDRQDGRSQLGYRCNLELVGQYQGIGAGWQNAWYGHCDYYDTAQNTTTPGVQVLDVSDPAHPRPTANLTSPAMLGPWESLKVSPQRGLLGAVAAYDAAGQGPLYFDVYDVKTDCAHPKQLASVPLNVPIGHEGNWSEDGMTYYGSSTLEASIAAIDVTNPSSPQLITVIKHGTHGLSTSPDGNLAYLTGSQAGVVGAANGLYILDISQVQSRATAPLYTEVGSTTWTDGSAAQHTIPISYGGHPYVLFVDEGGAGTGLSLTGPAGAARIIDVGDPKNPVVISKLKLEIHMPEHSDVQVSDTNGNGTFGYEGHYCAVDSKVDPTAVACGYFQSGIRVFDIRNPTMPREIAYFNPPAQVQKHGQLPGSEHAGTATSIAQPNNLTADWCASQVRFYHAPDGSWQLWGQCQDNGFMALRFTNNAYPLPLATGAVAGSTLPTPDRGMPNTGAGAPLPVIPLCLVALGLAYLVGFHRFARRGGWPARTPRPDGSHRLPWFWHW